MTSLPARGELAGALFGLRRVFWTLGGFSFAINVLLLAPAVYMLQVYDRVLTSRNESTLLLLTLLLAGLLALEAALEFLRSRVLVRVSAALDLGLNARVLEASFERTLAGGGGNPARPLADLTTVRQFLTGKGLFACFDVPWTPLYLLVAFLLHPALGLFAALAAGLLLILAWVNERATAPLVAEAGKCGTASNQYAAASLRNAEVIEALGMLPRLRMRWLAQHHHYLATQGAASDRAAQISSLSRFFRTALQSGILGFGALLALRGELTPGAMIAASILLGRALAPVDLVIGSWRGFVSAREAYQRLAGLLAEHPARSATLSLPAPRGEVAVENLVVAPPGSRIPILKGLSFLVPAGGAVAVIGPSASGKSTLARALVGAWPPLSGVVRLDGAGVHTWNKEELGPHVGYLPQDVELFDGTVAENISRFGELDSVGIVRAARKAGVHDMILRLPEGYETQIGEGGATLSAGQRQRVALARALYGEPALVVLDEPNANLDEAGDAALVAALQALKSEKRTVFVVTHRTNILRVVDAVLVLAGGMVREFGPRDEVLKPRERTA